jgi:predicted DNA-binding transcriptional regulator AlpA
MPNEPLAVEALQVPDTVAARLAGVSRATWWRLHAAAKTPAAVKLGRKVLWNRAELLLWIELKCPRRLEFEAHLAQARRMRRVIGPWKRQSPGWHPAKA